MSEKPDIRELIGVAVNTSALDSSELHERAVDRIAALGAAALEVTLGADHAGLPIAAMDGALYRRSADMRDVMLEPGEPDERDRIVGELGPTLWHIRYGAQFELLPSAVVLFAQWLGHRRVFSEFKSEEQQAQLRRFAACVLHESLSDRCIACGGCGKEERGRTGSWLRPRGSMQRNAVFRPCQACGGNGLARPSHRERARWIEVSVALYDADRWGQRFNAAHTWLRFLVTDRLHRPLTRQLEHRTKRD